MKHLTKNGGGAALLVLFLTASSSFAQTTYYIDPANGSGTGCTLAAPCTLASAYGKTLANNDQFLIRVRRVGGTVTLAAHSADLTKEIVFGAYVKGSGAAVEGTVKFTGDFKVGSGGRFKLHEKASVEFKDFTAKTLYPIGWDPDPWERLAITGTLEAPSTGGIILDRLVVNKSFTTAGIITVNNGVTVNRGDTLRLGNNLWVLMRKGTSNTDGKGLITVNGSIEAVTGRRVEALLIYHRNYDIADGRGPVLGAGANGFHTYSEYTPVNGAIDHTDCLRVVGSGTINAAFRSYANGNICYDLKKVGRVEAIGSIQNDVSPQKGITTDIIFRKDVEVNGDVEQWGDSRVVFGKTAKIKGNVILTDGTGIDGDNFVLSTTSVRIGVRNGPFVKGSKEKFTCAYITKRKAGDTKQRGAHIPGVQFEDAVTIEGDLEVRSSRIQETTVHATDSTMTKCAPRVLFMAPLTKKTITSRIGGDLVIEDDEDFNNDEDYSDGGRVRLTSYVVGKTVNSTHNVQIDGDIIAGGTTLGMEHESSPQHTGMCGSVGFTAGNRIVLSDKKAHVISGSLTLGALQIAEDLDVQNGTLTVKHLHVRSGGELTSSDDVKLDGGALILEGDGLQGTLADGSTITHLVYGNRDTDLVASGALVDTLDLTIDIGDGGELRLDQVTKTKNLGLCSGTLVLRKAGTATDSTLSVHEQITVKNGRLKKDTGSIATDKNRYHLKYITPGKLTVTDALEWFNPQDVTVDHKSAEIMVVGARSLMGTLTVTNGKLVVDGMVTAGHVTLSNASELHTKEDKVVVNGKVTLNGTSRLMTGGGDLQVSGQVRSGRYTNNTAQVTVAAKAKIDLGTGTLMLGPEDTAKRTGLTAAARPDVLLKLDGEFMGMISVPKGSKETTIHVATISEKSKELKMITFDGTPTPGDKNDAGLLKITGVDTEGKMLVIDSLSATQGSVETRGSHVKFTRDVHLSSGNISPYGKTTTFMKDLKLSGTGGLSTEKVVDDTLSVAIHGDFMQTEGKTGSSSGVSLHAKTTKTVKGDFVVSADPAPYKTKRTSKLIVEGDFHYMKDTLHAKVEFKGEEAQEVKTGTKTELDSVVVDNAKGLRLASSVMQGEKAGLTLRRGRITNADTTATAKAHTWTVKNPQIEENLKGRTSALEAKKCGADEDEACKFSISRGSLQSHASMVSFARHLEHGNSGDGAMSGGYLFPVGNTEGKQVYYRPLMLQLPFDLTDAKATTVSVMTDSETRLADPLTVPGPSGQSLTLDVHSDMFWKIEMDESLESEVNVRVVATGLRNVSDVKGLRIVQWDCEWENPKLAGRYSATIAAGSFGVNDLLNGVVNVTQERVNLEACTILGIAANGVENPINLEDLSGGRARLQFIHNTPDVQFPVDVYLGDIRISSSLQFRGATAYRTVGAGDYELTIRADGLPEDEAPDPVSLTLRNNRNYVVIAHGSTEDSRMKVLETQLESSVTNKADAILVHGSSDLGAVDVRVLDASDNLTPLMTLADNIPFDGKTSYRTLDASMHNVQVSSPNNEEEYEVFRMDLGGYRNETLVLNLSGSKDDLRILGVDKNGTTFLPDVITGVETERAELPTEFALHGNYPNPFNPSTRIQFDLPETAQVRVQIVDMLGREVMSLPAQEFEAGANRSMEIHAMNLASGTYLYRIIATGAENRHVKTGRMTLVK